MDVNPSYFIFSTNHFLCVFETLNGYAFKWEDLGYSLRFLPRDINNIKASPTLLHSAPSSFLRKLLEEWFERRHMHTLPPTLENLVEALNSLTVGLPALSLQLRRNIHQYDLISQNLVEIASITDEGKIEPRSSDTIQIEENMPISMRVKSSNTTFQWLQEGLMPIGGSLYSNMKTNTLCITKASIDMDGSEYTCETPNCDGAMIRTPPVTLRVNCPQLDIFKEDLSSTYLREVPDALWPPVPYTTYVQLALIKQDGNYCFQGDCTNRSISKALEDNLSDKDIISYDDIFKGLRSESLLLIEGRPGSGKTTFVHKIARDWADNKLCGPRRLLLLISLRLLNNWKAPISLKDMLELLNMERIEAIITERRGRGVCFVFDELDEFSPVDKSKSIVFQIILKKFLPQSVVVVTSRPSALIQLRQKANKIIEIIGFRREQIYEYIESYPFKNDAHRNTKITELKEYLTKHPNILHMCYLPIHTAMIAYLFQVTGGKISHTETELYTHITRFSLIRNLMKSSEENVEDITIDKMNIEERDLFKRICCLAFENILLNKQVIDEEEVETKLNKIDSGDMSLGLITVDCTAGLYGFKNIYTFLHLTYQEYLAAYYISTLDHEDQHMVIYNHKNRSNMENVWKFYCGLTKLEEYKYQIMELFSGKDHISLSDIHCIYESQQEQYCTILMKQTRGSILLNSQYFSTVDFIAIGYLLANTSLPASLSISRCNIDLNGINVLLLESKDRSILMDSLMYEMEYVDLEVVIRILANVKGLKILKLRQVKSQILPSNTIDDHFLEAVCLSSTNLEVLHLDNLFMGKESVMKLFMYSKSLKDLTLSNCIEEDDIENLLIAMTCSTNIEKLICTTNCLHIQMSSTLVHQFDNLFIKGKRNCSTQSLKINGKIKEMYLHHCCEYFQSLEVIKVNMPPNQMEESSMCISNFNLMGLQQLGLCNIVVRDSEAKSLAKSLQDSSKLEDLHFGSIRITSHGISSILTSVKNSSSLKKIVLNGTHLDTSCVTTLACCLPSWPRLKQLHLRECNIKEEGAKAMVHSLHNCDMNNLKDIEVAGNSISLSTLKRMLYPKDK